MGFMQHLKLHQDSQPVRAYPTGWRRRVSEPQGRCREAGSIGDVACDVLSLYGSTKNRIGINVVSNSIFSFLIIFYQLKHYDCNVINWLLIKN